MGTKKRLAGPVALTTALTTTVYNQGSALITTLIKEISVTNKSGSASVCSLWLGAAGVNAAGTEVLKQAIPANTTLPFFFELPMSSTEFLVGGADANTALTVIVMGEQSVV